MGSAWVQLGFSVVQRAEPKLNPTHELVCRELFFYFLTFWDRFRIIILFCLFFFFGFFSTDFNFKFQIILGTFFCFQSFFRLGSAWVQLGFSLGSAWVQHRFSKVQHRFSWTRWTLFTLCHPLMVAWHIGHLILFALAVFLMMSRHSEHSGTWLQGITAMPRCWPMQYRGGNSCLQVGHVWRDWYKGDLLFLTGDSGLFQDKLIKKN